MYKIVFLLLSLVIVSCAAKDQKSVDSNGTSLTLAKSKKGRELASAPTQTTTEPVTTEVPIVSETNSSTSGDSVSTDSPPTSSGTTSTTSSTPVTSPTSTTSVTPVVITAPVTTGAYEVHPGCEYPSASYSKSIYVDPNLGNDTTGDGSQFKPFKTLSSLISKKLLKGGEHLYLLAGSYGNIGITSSNSPQLVANANWIWFDFQPGATAGFVDIRGMSRFLLTGLTATGRTQNKYIIDVGYNSSQIVVADNSVYSAPDQNNTAAEWMALSNGIDVSQTYCGTMLRNKVRFVRHALGIGYSGTLYPTNSCRILAQENDIQHFSGDGLRMNCSDLMIIKNKMIDGYVSAADGDGNHDDFMQGFALNGAVYENILVEENYLLDRSDRTRALQSDYQGISVFDGLFKKVVVRKNVVIGGAYHGISFAGAEDVLIENNTVISSTGLKTYWIRASNSKTGVAPINNIAQNNLANKFSGSFVALVNNYVVLSPVQEFISFDFVNSLFDFHLKTTSQFYGKGAGAY